MNFENILGLVAEIRQQPERCNELLPHLDEQANCYQGRGSGECERLRGFILASLEKTGWSGHFLPFVVEELETGLSPYGIGGAARALRGCSHPPSNSIKLLLEAFERMSADNRKINLDSYEVTQLDNRSISVLEEIMETLKCLWPSNNDEAGPLIDRFHIALKNVDQTLADKMERILQMASTHTGRSPACCGSTAQVDSTPSPKIEITKSFWKYSVQNQDGDIDSLGNIILGRPTLLTFFYTRCMNPLKCSLTITKLGRLQNTLAETGLSGAVNLVAITYDSLFDLPHRMMIYGKDRGIEFDETTQLLRLQHSNDRLFDDLKIGVGYGPATVNRHRLDALIFDRAGIIAETFSRKTWEPAEMRERLAMLSNG